MNTVDCLACGHTFEPTNGHFFVCPRCEYVGFSEETEDSRRPNDYRYNPWDHVSCYLGVHLISDSQLGLMCVRKLKELDCSS